MEIRTIPWQDTLALRRAVLWPDASLEAMKLDDDDTGWHYGAFENGELVAVASVFVNNGEARLRKFATATQHQRRGIGSAMLRHILARLHEAHCTRFWCDARESALPLYTRFGLQPEGERFFKSDIPYFRMGVGLRGGVRTED